MHDSQNADAATVTGTSQREGQPLPDSKQEAFAQAIALGVAPAEACRKTFRYRTAATVEKKSATLLADPAITARIATLQRQASEIAEHHAHFSKADLINFLVETIQSPVSTIDQHHRQCQEWTRDELTASGRRANPAAQQKTQPPVSAATKGQGTSRRRPLATADITSSTDDTPPPPILLRSKTKLPSKLDAAKLLATLCGWNAPTKLEGKVNLGISPTVEEALTKLLT